MLDASAINFNLFIYKKVKQVKQNKNYNKNKQSTQTGEKTFSKYLDKLFRKENLIFFSALYW